MARREYGDEDDMDAGDLRSMKQVYGALMRQGASTEDLAGAYDELGKVDSYSYEPTIL